MLFSQMLNVQKRDNICVWHELNTRKVWCSSPVLNKLAGERKSGWRAGIIYLNKEPTQGFSQHKGERTLWFRGRCEQARGGGHGMQPNPDLCAFSIMKSVKQKAEHCGVTGQRLPWAAATHPSSGVQMWQSLEMALVHAHRTEQQRYRERANCWGAWGSQPGAVGLRPAKQTCPDGWWINGLCLSSVKLNTYKD